MYIQVIQLLETEGAPEAADSGGPPAMGRWAGGASPPLPPFPASDFFPPWKFGPPFFSPENFSVLVS